MKLITEANEDLQIITEAAEGGAKKYFIEGIYLQGKIKNRNGRVYPVDTLIREVNRYSTNYISQNRSFGELGHPEGPQINLDRVSHIIRSLKQEGTNFIGRAEVITENPMGKIVKNFIDIGAKLAVSSRGMGTIRNIGGVDTVQEDFTLATPADIVADPSAPDAFVNGIMEGVEWIWDNGMIKSRVVEGYKRNIKNAPSGLIKEQSIAAFRDFVNRLSRTRNS